MKTVYIVYHNWYSMQYHDYQRSVNAIFETLEDAEFYVDKQYRPSEYEIEDFYEYYKEGYKNRA